MHKDKDMLSRGVDFVRKNPQLLYTIFLIVFIPLAFFYTSQQFLNVSLDNENILEQNRLGFLMDSFSVFVPAHINEPEYLSKRIDQIIAYNLTITNFEIISATTTASGTPGYMLVASNHGTSTEAYHLDTLTEPFLGTAANDPRHTFSIPYTTDNGRFWHSIRAVEEGGSITPVAYIIVDLSLAQSDAIAINNMRNSYYVLVVIIILIMVLLIRHARIVDYVTLYQRLKEVDNMKDDFVSMAAHELRSPLTVIRGYVEMIDEDKGLNDSARGLLKNIDMAASQLTALVGDILDVSKLQEGRMSFKFETIDVSDHIAAVVDSFQKPAQNKGLQLFYDKKTLPIITIDPDRFRQTMINLVGNAVKYTPKGEVRVLTNTVNNRLEIRISDTGMGISAADQVRLFEKFYRVKSVETQHITGTGLGLWITAQIVRQMKGVISVESIKGKGTDFILTFPIAK